MPLPASVTTVPVHIQILGEDGAAAKGRVAFVGSHPLRDTTGNVIVGPPQYSVTLDAAGEATVSLIATDDPDVSPSGWTYTVTIATDVLRDTYQIQIPAATVGTLELADIAPAVTPQSVVTYALDSAAVHRSGDEDVDGVKRFAESPSVPTPASSGDAASKGYVDSGDTAVASAAAADATSKASAAQAAAIADATTKYASVVQLPASTGSDDTATINTALAANAGKRVRGLPGQTYLISAPLVVYSGTELDMTGCTVTLKANSNSNILNNAAVAAVTRLTDAAMTSGSAALTSAAGRFTAGMVGKAITVNGAGTGGVPLTTTVASYQSATQVTLTASAGTTVSGQYAAIGARDSNITIAGGTWVRSTSNGASANGWDKHSLRFRHCDGLAVRGVSVQTSSEKYAVSVADCNDVTIDRPTLSVFSDGIHIAGPSARLYVGNVHGTTGDDSIAVTPRDWTAYDDAFGDVTDITVENVFTTSTAAAVLKFLGGSPLTALKRATGRGLFGAGNNNAIFIGDDTGQPNTTGGLLADIAVMDVHCSVPNSQSLVYLTPSNAQNVRLSGLWFSNANSTSPIVNVNGSTLGTLVFEDVHVQAMGATPVLRVSAGYTISRCIVDRMTIASAGAGAVGADVKGTITDLAVRGVLATLTGSSYVVSLNGSDPGATVNRLTISDTHVVGTGGGLISATASTHTLPNVEIVSTTLSGTAWLVDLNTTTELHLAGVTTKSPTSGIANLRANAVVTFIGDGNNLAVGGQGIKVTAGGKAAVRIIDCPPATTAGGFPTITAGAGAGTAPTVTVAGSDRAGTVTITPGTGPSAGVQATVTFIGTWPQTPKVALTPTNAAAQAAGAYVSSKSTTTFAISSANSPGGSMTFDYVVMA